MADHDGYAPLAPESDTLHGLPNAHRTGLIAVGTAALISFISTTTLFLFLSYKLVAGSLMNRRRTGRLSRSSSELALELPNRHFSLRESASHQFGEDPKSTAAILAPSDSQVRNPFPLLIYNLLFAEMQTSLGYTLNIEWVARNGIYVGTTTCWAQGWLNNFGVLASSIFLVSISINTYLSVVRGWRPPRYLTVAWITLCWVLTLALTSAGIIQTSNGRAEGGWFVRANTWCWVNAKYGSARLWGEWAWILGSIPVTVILYSLVLWSLYRENRSSRHLPRHHNRHDHHHHTTSSTSSSLPENNNLPSGHHPAFLVYPFIYIACTSPLAIARLITISGGSPSVTYYCIAGLTLATNGFWNTILWSTTMLISTPQDMRDTGLDQFAFIRTPVSRRYGNMVWINGPGTRRQQHLRDRSRDDGGNDDGGWWWWRTGGQASDGKKDRGGGGEGGLATQSRNTSQQSLSREVAAPVVTDNAIHMDIITTVVVEENTDTMADTIHSASTSSTGGKKSAEHDLDALKPYLR